MRVPFHPLSCLCIVTLFVVPNLLGACGGEGGMNTKHLGAAVKAAKKQQTCEEDHERCIEAGNPSADCDAMFNECVNGSVSDPSAACIDTFKACAAKAPDEKGYQACEAELDECVGPPPPPLTCESVIKECVELGFTEQECRSVPDICEDLQPPTNCADALKACCERHNGNCDPCEQELTGCPEDDTPPPDPEDQ